MDAITEKFVDFLYRECGVESIESWVDLGELDRNVWRAEYCGRHPDLLDDLNYIETQQLAAKLAAVFVAQDGGPNSPRNRLTAHADLGRLVADFIAKKADEAGDYYVNAAEDAGYFSDRSQ
jgi:hypothetical protein